MNIGEMQRKLSLWAEQDKERKFHDLYALLCQDDWLRLAYAYVAQNAGSKTAGCDGINMSEFEADLEGNLVHLKESLRSETFVACPVRRVYIPKANGQYRPLGIPTIRDRIVQEAVRMILEPIFEADFCQHSFGFRPNRRTMDAIKNILWYTQESTRFFWIIEGDISSYFDTIHHRKLIQLLRQRIKDERLLTLIWKFLRAGVMERKLFKDTKLGTPQGGIVSPLLANVYLHELDKYMERYLGLTQKEKTQRRRTGQANYAYVRYADDFVILCNGGKAEAMEMRQEIRDFLASQLRLTLSMEKTKVTHLNDGFDFLGFTVQRTMGQKGMTTKVLISPKGLEKHLGALRAATSPRAHEDSATLKFKALNKIIAGWCRYYQYTSKASTQFVKLSYKTFWRAAHWLGRKYQLTMPQVMAQYRKGNTFEIEGVNLVLHMDFHTQLYKQRFLKPNPYTHQEKLDREELPDDNPWPGFEARPGWTDTKNKILERDGWTCRLCKKAVTPDTCQVDHITPYHRFKRPVDADRPDNLWTLCLDCHSKKTEYDRRMESRMQ